MIESNNTNETACEKECEGKKPLVSVLHPIDSEA